MGPQGLLVLGLPAPFVPHSASLSPATAAQVLSTPVPVSAPPTSLDEWLFSIFLVLVPLVVRVSVSSGCARRRSVSTYAAILVLHSMDILMMTSLPIHDMVCASTYLYLLQFLSSVSYNFPSTGLLHPWLNLFPGILFFLKQL